VIHGFNSIFKSRREEIWYDVIENKLLIVGDREYVLHDWILLQGNIFYIGVL
jgi:hypothetical protein